MHTTGHADAREAFDSGSVRGRYVGHVDVAANLVDGTNVVQLGVHLLTALTFDGRSATEGAGRVTVSVPGQAPFTCPFDITGSYQIGTDGLGTGTLALAPTGGAACGSGGATLQVSLVVGGHNRSRLDINIDGAVDGQGEPLPLVGAGTLQK